MADYHGIYVHIPFCRKKCYYCDFPSQAGLLELSRDYVDALCAEISACASSLFVPKSIYFGGGTPTLFSTGELREIVDTLQRQNYWQGEQERTIEANPGTVDMDKLLAVREMGFNRLSFGVQSFSNRLLASIGRIHTAEEARAALVMAKEAGFDNISIDLMYGLPGQSLADLRESIGEAVRLGVQHISAYSLIVEEATPLADMLESGRLFLPEETEENAMYDWLMAYLPPSGYARYEVSNFAQPGFCSLHNSQYWQYLPYKGFGAAACSFDGEKRHNNNEDIKNYIQNPLESDEELLSEAQRMAEFIFMGLRMTEGISPQKFYLLFNKDVYEIFGRQLKAHEQTGYIEADRRIKLTPAGMKIGNKIFLTFLP